MKNHLPTLDGWRGVAISMVVAYHLLSATFEKDTTLHRLVRQGSRGVDVFFGLSGLLITSLLLREQEVTGSIDLARFYVRRAFRILPPYLTYLGVVSALSAIGILKVTRRELLSCLFFYRDYLPLPDLKNWYTAHFWTLSVEEHFYLVCPLLIGCGSTSKLACRAALVACGVAVWRKIYVQSLATDTSWLGRTDLCVDGLIWGMFAALALHQPWIGDRVRRHFTPRWYWLVLFVLIWIAWREPPFGLSIQAFLIPWMLVGTINNPQSILSRFLEWKFLRWLGRISYSLYIWQQVCISEVWSRIEVAKPLEGAPMMVLALMAALALSVISFYGVEQPCLRRGRALLELWLPATTRPRAAPRLSGTHQAGSP